MVPQLLVSLNDVAEMLQLSRRTIERLVADGTVPSVKIRSRRLLAREGIERLLTHMLSPRR